MTDHWYAPATEFWGTIVKSDKLEEGATYGIRFEGDKEEVFKKVTRRRKWRFWMKESLWVKIDGEEAEAFRSMVVIDKQAFDVF